MNLCKCFNFSRVDLSKPKTHIHNLILWEKISSVNQQCENHFPTNKSNHWCVCLKAVSALLLLLQFILLLNHTWWWFFLLIFMYTVHFHLQVCVCENVFVGVKTNECLVVLWLWWYTFDYNIKFHESEK